MQRSYCFRLVVGLVVLLRLGSHRRGLGQLILFKKIVLKTVTNKLNSFETYLKFGLFHVDVVHLLLELLGLQEVLVLDGLFHVILEDVQLDTDLGNGNLDKPKKEKKFTR